MLRTLNLIIWSPIIEKSPKEAGEETPWLFIYMQKKCGKDIQLSDMLLWTWWSAHGFLFRVMKPHLEKLKCRKSIIWYKELQVPNVRFTNLQIKCHGHSIRRVPLQGRREYRPQVECRSSMSDSTHKWNEYQKQGYLELCLGEGYLFFFITSFYQSIFSLYSVLGWG